MRARGFRDADRVPNISFVGLSSTLFLGFSRRRIEEEEKEERRSCYSKTFILPLKRKSRPRSLEDFWTCFFMTVGDHFRHQQRLRRRRKLGVLQYKRWKMGWKDPFDCSSAGVQNGTVQIVCYKIVFRFRCSLRCKLWRIKALCSPLTLPQVYVCRIN